MKSELINNNESIKQSDDISPSSVDVLTVDLITIDEETLYADKDYDLFIFDSNDELNEPIKNSKVKDSNDILRKSNLTCLWSKKLHSCKNSSTCMKNVNFFTEIN